MPKFRWPWQKRPGILPADKIPAKADAHRYTEYKLEPTSAESTMYEKLGYRAKHLTVNHVKDIDALLEPGAVVQVRLTPKGPLVIKVPEAEGRLLLSYPQLLNDEKQTIISISARVDKEDPVLIGELLAPAGFMLEGVIGLGGFGGNTNG